MNANFELTYLEGGDDWFGPEPGRCHGLYQHRARAMSTECPNVGKLLNNLEFTLAMENEIMGAILDDGAGSRCGRDRLAQRERRCAGRLAGRCDHQGWRRRDGRREGRAGHVIDQPPLGASASLDRSGGCRNFHEYEVPVDWLTETKIPVGRTAEQVFDWLQTNLRLVLRRARRCDGSVDRRDPLGAADAASA